MPLHYPIQVIEKFFKLESASSILLLFSTVVAMVMSNIAGLQPLYQQFLSIPLGLTFGELSIEKTLLLWINDGLMAIFFLLVGLELKREKIEGELSDLSQVVLPVIAAIGGMLIPALIYVAFNYQTPEKLIGWAIPSATDIAFSLGILALLGKRVPISLKIFLMALAIIDDLGAIIIIAIFYSGHGPHHVDPTYLGYAAMVVGVLFILNISRVSNVLVYLLVGVVLWVFILNSGVHATLAGVILAFFIPLNVTKEQEKDKRYKSADPDDSNIHSPLRELEHDLHPWVAFAIMPIFAFANAGVSFEGMSIDTVFASIPLGIILGLFVGKMIGVFGFSWITVKAGFAKLPEGATWSMLLGVAILCGVGFTMSLFIGSLAFADPADMNQVRLGVLLGSFVSAISGYLILLMTTQSKSN